MAAQIAPKRTTLRRPNRATRRSPSRRITWRCGSRRSAWRWSPRRRRRRRWCRRYPVLGGRVPVAQLVGTEREAHHPGIRRWPGAAAGMDRQRIPAALAASRPGTALPTTPGRRRGWDRRLTSFGFVTCNLGAWPPRVNGSANIASGCAPKASGQFKSGCPTYGHRNSSRKLTASRRPSPPASMRPTTKHSSTRSPLTGPPRVSRASEAWRSSHRCSARCLHG